MKKLLIILFISLIQQMLMTQWLSDDNLQQGPEDQEFQPGIRFNNINTGWEVHPFKKDSVYKTTDGGLIWFGFPTGDTNRLSGLFFIDNNTGWVVGQHGKIAKSTNGGTTWLLQNSGVLSWLNSVQFFDSNTGYAVGSKDSNRVILKTTNGGANWQVLLRNNQSRLYSVSVLSPQVVYCVGDSGAVVYTSNGGTNWINQVSGATSTLRDVIFKNYGPVSIGWIAGKNGVILSTSNGGTNWISRSFNTINYYGIDFGSFDTGYVCGRGRIYKTVNGGLNWFQQITPVSDTINIKDIICINAQNVWAVPWSGNLIYTTNGGGPIGIDPISNEIPTGYLLEQNYPNPFNPNTKIQFSIPNSSFAKLTIYDVTGRVMAILVNEELRPGKYEVEWDASHRASGIYYYMIEVNTPRSDKSEHPSQEGNFTETKKMVLVK